MLAANEIKVDTNELVQILTLTRKEILELENPFGCGDSPLFTYPFFGEDQLINLSIPPGTSESVLESLEIVLCVETSFTGGRDCFLGASDGRILRDARRKIQEKLTEMVETIGSEIKFHHSWTEYQQAIRSNNEIKLDELFNPVDKNVFKLMKPGERGALYDRLQVLLPFFIEAATPIDSSDPKWTIYLNTAECNGESSRITGLLTTYSYFKFPEGLRVRISQVLIFPRDQGKRLGTRLYQSVSRSLRVDEDCQEICVEDPTDGFEKIRGLIDWQEANDKGIFEKEDSLVIKDLTKELKLTCEHAERILNLNKSLLAEQSNPSKRTKTASSEDDPTTVLRQTIKRWLLRKFKKDLPEDKVERIEKLAELYEGEMEEFIEPIIEMIKS